MCNTKILLQSIILSTQCHDPCHDSCHQIRHIFIPEKYHLIISSDIHDENLEHDKMSTTRHAIVEIQNRDCIGYYLVWVKMRLSFQSTRHFLFFLLANTIILQSLLSKLLEKIPHIPIDVWYNFILLDFNFIFFSFLLNVPKMAVYDNVL